MKIYFTPEALAVDSWPHEMGGNPMDEKRVSGLKKIGSLVDCDVLGRAAASGMLRRIVTCERQRHYQERILP